MDPVSQPHISSQCLHATPSLVQAAGPALDSPVDNKAAVPEGHPSLRGRSRQNRRTVELECLNCREIKKKCSGGDPCKPCINKGKAHTCVRATRKDRKPRVRSHRTIPSESAGSPSVITGRETPAPAPMAVAPASSADMAKAPLREVGTAPDDLLWSTVGHSGEQYPVDVDVFSGAGGWQGEVMNTVSEGHHPGHWVGPALNMAAFVHGQYVAPGGAYRYDTGIAAFQSTVFGDELPQLFSTL